MSDSKQPKPINEGYTPSTEGYEPSEKGYQPNSQHRVIGGRQPSTTTPETGQLKPPKLPKER